MKHLFNILGLIAIIFILIPMSCEDKNNIKINCKNLKNGILNQDEAQIRSEISMLTQDLKPNPTPNDEWGHLRNFELLIDRLNQCDEINAVSFCYCCIETNPPQSEILITTYANSLQIQKIFDISTSKDTVLVYSGIHDTYN